MKRDNILSHFFHIHQRNGIKHNICTCTIFNPKKVVRFIHRAKDVPHLCSFLSIFLKAFRRPYFVFRCQNQRFLNSIALLCITFFMILVNCFFFHKLYIISYSFLKSDTVDYFFFLVN